MTRKGGRLYFYKVTKPKVSKTTTVEKENRTQTEAALPTTQALIEVVAPKMQLGQQKRRKNEEQGGGTNGEISPECRCLDKAADNLDGAANETSRGCKSGCQLSPADGGPDGQSSSPAKATCISIHSTRRWQ